MDSSERVILYRNSVGSSAIILASTVGYIVNNTWYRLRITRTESGAFTVYILGGVFGNTTWTLVDTTGGTGTNPVIDTTHITSKFCLIDLDVGDRITNILLKRGINKV